MADLLYPAMTAGELSPNLFGRREKETYYKGLAKARNVYIRPEGGVVDKEGQLYITNTPSDSQVRKIDFEVDETLKYLLVFSAGRMDVYYADTLLLTVTVPIIAALTWDQINRMDFAQKGNTMYLTNKTFAPIKIVRNAHTTWTVTNPVFKNVPVFPFGGVTATEPAATVTPSAVSGKFITVTASAAIFTSAHVGQYINYKTGGLIKIVGYVSTTVVRGNVEVNLPSTSTVAAGDWELETGYEPAWSSVRGYPAACGLFQNRFWMGGSSSPEIRNGVWGSKTADLEDFDYGSAQDDDAIEVFLDDFNDVKFFAVTKNLIVFTSGGTYWFPTQVGDPITPSKSLPIPIDNEGISDVPPIFVDRAMLYVGKTGYTVHAIRYTIAEDNYEAELVSLLSSHLIRQPVRAATVRRGTESNPTNYAYYVNSDGTMAVLNLLKSQELLAWSLFEEENAYYEDICVVGSDVYVTVRRTINSVTRRFIEKFDPTLKLNAAKTTTGTTATSWSGFSHLNGATVKVFGDDWIQPDATVSGGVITTQDEVEEVEVGFAWTPKVELLPLDTVQFAGYPFTAKFKRVVAVWVQMQNTRDIVVKVGNNRFVPSLRNFGDSLLDEAPVLTTGWKLVPLSGAGRNATIQITRDEPGEFEILSLKVRIK